jgi:hypothetical protein
LHIVHAGEKWTGFWHPVLQIQLPKFPPVGARTGPDGTIVVRSFGMYTAFKKAMQGPTDSSNWLVQGRVMVGDYPTGQARLKDKRVGIVRGCSSWV